MDALFASSLDTCDSKGEGVRILDRIFYIWTLDFLIGLC
jgi:hypothetical protein